MKCLDCITKVMCTDTNCTSTWQPHLATHKVSRLYQWKGVNKAVTIYHGRALCEYCLASYLDEV